MSFKVAPFVSKEFNSLDKKEKEKFIKSYTAWKEHSISEMYLEWLQSEYDRLIKEDEAAFECETQFAFSSKLIANRAKRNILKQLINKI